MIPKKRWFLYLFKIMLKVPWMYIVILSIIELTALFIGTKSWKWEMFCLVSSSVKQLSDSEVKTTSTCVLLIFEPSIWNDLDFTSYKKWTIFKKNTVLETLNQIWYISYVRIKKKLIRILIDIRNMCIRLCFV